MALQIELINLKDSKDRLAAIDKVLTENELTYHRQEAAHGHNIRFLHEQSGKTFTGKELAEGKATLNTQLEAFNTYTVTCDPKALTQLALITKVLVLMLAKWDHYVVMT